MKKLTKQKQINRKRAKQQVLLEKGRGEGKVGVGN